MNKLIITAAILTALNLESPAHAETQIVIVKGYDNSSNEFGSSDLNSVAYFNMRRSGQYYTSHPNISGWIGYSFGPGWGPQIRTQTFVLRNTIPGRYYTLRLKFHWKSTPDMQLEAYRRGRGYEFLGTQILSDWSMNGYLSWTVLAIGGTEEILVTHPYNSGLQTYAQLDYLEISEQ